MLQNITYIALYELCHAKRREIETKTSKGQKIEP